jgi:ABC-type protease/lipase transport system fused ATPase/permease subunit
VVQTLREQKSSVFMVVHPRDLLSVADRVLVMKEGRVAHFGTLAEVVAQGAFNT